MIRTFLLLLSFALVVNGQIPHTFDSGSVAKASEVNENFTYLVGRIDSLKNENTNLKAQIDTLKSVALLPIGTVLATMVQMDTLNGIWVLADGRASTMEYFQATGEDKVPDMRGMFLRGINAGLAGALADPDGERVAGNIQADTFAVHTHTSKSTSPTAVNDIRGTYFTSGVTNWGSVFEATTASGGAETRPNNAAVYWYVKAK